MKSFLSFFILVLSFVSLVGPECAEFLKADVHQNRIEAQVSIGSPEQASTSSTYHDTDCSGTCGDAAHLAHHCHFGHCGFISNVQVNLVTSAPAKFAFSRGGFLLAHFQADLLRPPIC